MADSNNTQSTDSATIEANLYRLNHPDHIKTIRSALVVGLASLGELERLQDEGIKVVHPTGCNDTVRELAQALMTLEELEDLPVAV
ncbi:MAG: hypothetical protein Q8M09_00335 [Pseudomonadota bacterium]|nr:hypothetical protein [Pseudomonadota bacterium]MDP1902692.1 hypothetical protein [Pseudomonadota bacterium]MDP2353370.1 hypothetical protein [Pseudomonadota bacterium]